ncbi:MAG: hypothetical protein V1816_12115 [Pseudomonadota bacterium]
MELNQNAAPIPFEDMLTAVKEVGALAGPRDIEKIVIRLNKLFPGDSQKIMGILFRLRALEKLIDHPGMRGWVLTGEIPGDAEPILVSAPVLKAAAIHPLNSSEEDAAFDPQTFFSLVLQLTEEEGRA